MFDWHEEVMARTLYGEARGEGIKGMAAVGEVILNRVDDPQRWPDTIAGVCVQPWQFSCWNQGDPNCEMLVAMSCADVRLAEAQEVARRVIGGWCPFDMGGANHYLTNALIKSGEAPSWYDPECITKVIGGHTFLNLSA